MGTSQWWLHVRRVRSLWSADWAAFSLWLTLVDGDLLNRTFSCEPVDNRVSFNLFHFWISVLVNELINVEETTTYSDEDLVAFLNFDVDSFLAKHIHTFRLPKEHDFHLLSFRIFINIISQSLINRIILLGDINSLILLQHFIQSDQLQYLLFLHGTFLFEKTTFLFENSNLLKQFNNSCLAFINLLFDRDLLVSKLRDQHLQLLSFYFRLIELFVPGADSFIFFSD